MPAHPDDHPGDHPDRDERDHRLELLLLALGQVLLGDVERPRGARAEQRPRRPTPSHIQRSASRRPCWRRNAAMMPTISAASRPSRRPMTKVGSTAVRLGTPYRQCKSAFLRAPGSRRSRGSRSTGSACRSAGPAPRPEQRGAELRRLGDADRPDRGRIVAHRVSLSASHCGNSEPCSSAIRLMLPMLVAGMIPGITGLSTPRPRGLDEVEVVLGVEEELGDGEVGRGQLLGGVAPVALARRASAGCGSGCAATPTEKSPTSRTSSTSSIA